LGQNEWVVELVSRFGSGAEIFRKDTSWSRIAQEQRAFRTATRPIPMLRSSRIWLTS